MKRFAFSVLANALSVIGLLLLAAIVALFVAVCQNPDNFIRVVSLPAVFISLSLWFRYEYYLVDRILEIASVFFGVKEEE